MLNIFSYSDTPKNKRIYNPDVIFDLNYKNEWLEDPLVRQIIRNVDNVEPIKDHLLKCPIFGYIAPSALSTGTKGLILMLKMDSLNSCYFLSDLYGENCFKWIFKISTLKDINLINSSWFLLPDDLDKSITYKVDFVKEGYVTSNLNEIWDKLFSM